MNNLMGRRGSLTAQAGPCPGALGEIHGGTPFCRMIIWRNRGGELQHGLSGKIPTRAIATKRGKTDLKKIRRGQRVRGGGVDESLVLRNLGWQNTDGLFEKGGTGKKNRDVGGREGLGRQGNVLGVGGGRRLRGTPEITHGWQSRKSEKTDKLKI